jgi:hypothetical protein
MITKFQRADSVPARWTAGGVRCGILLSALLGGFSCIVRPVLAAAPGTGAFPALQVAAREQAALVVSAGEDPARWPAAEVRAVASGWNAAALDASRTRVTAPLLREQWDLLVSGAAEAWWRLALLADSPVSGDKPAGADTSGAADTMATLASDARALGDDAAAILPAVRAVCEGKRAALLLTTSVGCECTMQRVALMEEVWTALAAGGSGTPDLAVAVRRVVAMGTDGIGDARARDLRPLLGRSDLASSPDLPDALGLDRVPGWLLLEPGGEIAFRVDGGEGVAEITTMIRRWLGGEDFHR